MSPTFENGAINTNVMRKSHGRQSSPIYTPSPPNRLLKSNQKCSPHYHFGNTGTNEKSRTFGMDNMHPNLYGGVVNSQHMSLHQQAGHSVTHDRIISQPFAVSKGHGAEYQLGANHRHQMAENLPIVGSDTVMPGEDAPSVYHHAHHICPPHGQPQFAPHTPGAPYQQMMSQHSFAQMQQQHWMHSNQPNGQHFSTSAQQQPFNLHTAYMPPQIMNQPQQHYYQHGGSRHYPENSCSNDQHQYYHQHPQQQMYSQQPQPQRQAHQYHNKMAQRQQVGAAGGVREGCPHHNNEPKNNSPFVEDTNMKQSEVSPAKTAQNFAVRHPQATSCTCHQHMDGAGSGVSVAVRANGDTGSSETPDRQVRYEGQTPQGLRIITNNPNLISNRHMIDSTQRLNLTPVRAAAQNQYNQIMIPQNHQVNHGQDTEMGALNHMELDNGANLPMQHDQQVTPSLFDGQQHSGQSAQMTPQMIPYYAGNPHYGHPMMMPGMAPPYLDMPCACPHILAAERSQKTHLMPAKQMENEQQQASKGGHLSVKTSDTKSKTPSGLKQQKQDLDRSKSKKTEQMQVDEQGDSVIQLHQEVLNSEKQRKTSKKSVKIKQARFVEEESMLIDQEEGVAQEKENFVPNGSEMDKGPTMIHVNYSDRKSQVLSKSNKMSSISPSNQKALKEEDPSKNGKSSTKLQSQHPIFHTPKTQGRQMNRLMQDSQSPPQEVSQSQLQKGLDVVMTSATPQHMAKKDILQSAQQLATPVSIPLCNQKSELLEVPTAKCEKDDDGQAANQEGQLSQQTGAQNSQLSNKKKCCKCEKSQCLKLYCECLKNGEFCGPSCSCITCKNVVGNNEREVAITSIRSRNQIMQPSVSLSQQDGVSGEVGQQTQQHLVLSLIKPLSCRCKKSKCQKRYCECFQAGRLCTVECQCSECHNFDNGCVHENEAGQKLVNSIANQQTEDEVFHTLKPKPEQIEGHCDFIEDPRELEQKEESVPGPLQIQLSQVGMTNQATTPKTATFAETQMQQQEKLAQIQQQQYTAPVDNYEMQDNQDEKQELQLMRPQNLTHSNFESNQNINSNFESYSHQIGDVESKIQSIKKVFEQRDSQLEIDVQQEAEGPPKATSEQNESDQMQHQLSEFAPNGNQFKGQGSKPALKLVKSGQNQNQVAPKQPLMKSNVKKNLQCLQISATAGSTIKTRSQTKNQTPAPSFNPINTGGQAPPTQGSAVQAPPQIQTPATGGGFTTPRRQTNASSRNNSAARNNNGNSANRYREQLP